MKFLSRSSFVASIALILIAVAETTVAAGDSAVTFKALADFRLAVTDQPRSWLDSGLGKARYGGSGREGHILGRLAEGSLLILPDFGGTVTGLLHLKFDDEQRRAIDIVEAVVRYRPVPTSDIRFQVRAGAFFPPISLEHTGMGWTTTRTISGSAINTWVGEELRALGIEFSAKRVTESYDVSLTGAVFGGNDPAGTLLAWRGWALHDRKSGLFDRVPLAPIPSIGPGGPFAPQPPWVEPFIELDDRLGYYAALRVRGKDRSEFRLMHYDNNADPTVFERKQYAWRTRFTSLGLLVKLPGETEMLAQTMVGSTEMGKLPSGAAAAESDFYALYLLIAKHIGMHRLALRYDYFDVDDVDPIKIDNNNEHGSAWTLAYGRDMEENQSVMVELQEIHSERPQRASLGQNVRANELLMQANYRITFR